MSDWRELTERERKRFMCASTNCDEMAAAYFEVDGLRYCASCRDRIDGTRRRGSR
jgi:hypothetical protein